jgi:hypothetical protein
LFEADDFTAGEAIGRHVKERVAGAHAVAVSFPRVRGRVRGKRRIGLDFERADGRV